MTSITAHKSTKNVQDSDSPTTSPLAGPGPGGHKASCKGTKLARRARSFKDDFLGKISQIRSPTTCTNQTIQSTIMGGRSNSPKSRTTQHKSDLIDNYHHKYNNKGPSEELDDLWKQTQVALKHFRDVVIKHKLEMLPGNGTIILDTVWMINLAVKSSVTNDTSSTILSATNHMYQSVARLIKLCDDALIDDKSAELDRDNVNEIVVQVEEAVHDLIKLAQEKIAQQQQSYQHSNGSSSSSNNNNNNNKTTPRSSFSNTIELTTQRNSLPDIPLTPRERQILEQTTCTPSVVRGSHSSESILRDPSPPPPPKPPLPDGVFFGLNHSDPDITPPPLPPKKRNYRLHHQINDCYSADNSPITSSLERVSMRSKSPEGSLSLLSVSAGSTDSILNHSKADEELRVLMDQGFDDESFENRTSDIFGVNSSHISWEESSLNSNISNQIVDYHRLSNTDSGILSSSQSYRSSSYSKRSSQQSTTTTQHFTTTSSTTTKQQQQQQQENIKIEKTSSSSSSSSLISTIVNVTTKDEPDFINLDDDGVGSGDKDVPPAIPQKTRQKSERQPSPYDNVPDLGGELLVTCQMHQSHQSSNTSISSVLQQPQQDTTKPPPLPPKKKHIMAYMEMFGNCSHTNEQEFMRHSVHMVQQQWSSSGTTTAAATTTPQTSTPNLTTTQSCSFSHISHNSSRSSSHTVTMLNLPQSEQRIPSPIRSPLLSTTQATTPPALPPKQRIRKQSPPTTPIIQEIKQSPVKTLPDLLEHTTTITPPPLPTTTTTITNPTTAAATTTTSKSNDNNNKSDEDVNPCDIDLMDELNVEQWLILKKPEEDGPDIRGGPIDALIIQATKATKNGVFIYQEAFLTTYRTFITPYELIRKLIRRYNHFYYQPDKKPRSREAFALIVRVVSDLTASDLDEPLQCKLMNFVQQLISCGELTLAKALRVKHLERHEAKQLSLKYTNIVTSLTLSSRNFTLLDFKSEQIAEQMTLLDAELFMKIEIPEVLIWAQEQNEERSPNLTRFTEHFNKMSYWARTKILTAELKDIREKYFLKFIKIMKHLRKINNFNSYLALLSALDSAPIRRLEWQKHVQEGLKEYCALIDSSSSFRAYRQALAETQPPCIPYIGLVLQDLTFVHIGNSNLLSDGTINFSKRWQQFNIVENMKKFKKGTYMFKKNERIIQFFQNFDDFIGEDAMWQLSESIKPRGCKKAT